MRYKEFVTFDNGASLPSMFVLYARTLNLYRPPGFVEPQRVTYAPQAPPPTFGGAFVPPAAAAATAPSGSWFSAISAATPSAPPSGFQGSTLLTPGFMQSPQPSNPPTSARGGAAAGGIFSTKP